MAKRLMSAIFGITYVVLVLVFNGRFPILLNLFSGGGQRRRCV